MLKRWGATVRDSHSVLHLGDLFFSRKRGLERFTNEVAPKLSGKKYLILGNHDRHDLDYEKLGFTVLDPYSIKYDGYTVSFNHYPTIIHPGAKELRVHGHIHANGYRNTDQSRINNINVSVEVIAYRPQHLHKLLNAAILARRGKDAYYNSKGYRVARTEKARRAA